MFVKQIRQRWHVVHVTPENHSICIVYLIFQSSSWCWWCSCLEVSGERVVISTGNLSSQPLKLYTIELSTSQTVHYWVINLSNCTLMSSQSHKLYTIEFSTSQTVHYWVLNLSNCTLLSSLLILPVWYRPY